MFLKAEAIRTTVVPINILIRTSDLIVYWVQARTTVVPIRILIRTTGMWLTICVAYLNFVLHLLWFYGYFFDLMCSIVINNENYLLKQCLNH